MKKNVIIFFLLVLAASCNNSADKQAPANEAADHTEHTNAAQEAKPQFTADMVDNKKDFACGMPVSAGISDTAHYEGKVYGFCSRECKDEFMKDPAGYLAKQ